MNLLSVRYLQMPARGGVIAASLYLVSRREYWASRLICDAVHRRIKRTQLGKASLPDPEQAGQARDEAAELPRISLPSHLYMGANIRNCLNCVTQFTQWNHLGSWLRYEP